MDKLELGVEVDNARHVPLLSLSSRTSGRLPMTTIAPRQRRAIVKVSVLRNGRPTVVDEIQVTGVALGGHDHPKIDLEGRHDGRGLVTLTLFLDGKRYTAKTIDVSRFMPRRSSSAWLVAVFAVILVAAIGGLAFLLTRDDFALAREATGSAAAGERIDTAREDRASDSEAPRDARQETPVASGDSAAADPAPGVVSDAPSRTASPRDAPPTRPRSRGAATDQAEGEGAAGERSGADPTTQEPSFAGPVEDVAPPRESDPVVVYFFPNSSEIRPEVRMRLSRLYGVLRQYPDYRLIIEGHCAIAGSEAGRAEISENRARNVREVLESLGWEFGERSRVVGRGASDPETTDESLQYLNRRVEIWALPPASQ